MAVPEITQDMINAYDDYTHLTLDRRGFMEKLTKLAGSARPPPRSLRCFPRTRPSPLSFPLPTKRLKAEDITYPGASGTMSGYLAMPANATGTLPAVVVIHENRGLNPHIEDVTRRIALDGFLALAPDLLSRPGGTPRTRTRRAT